MADLVCGAQQRHPFCGTYKCELVYGHDGDHQAACRAHHGCLIVWGKSDGGQEFVAQNRDGKQRAVYTITRLGRKPRTGGA